MNKQELYLLDRYISAEYMKELRDTWGRLVSHVEHSLKKFELDLPPQYRSLKLPQQPDIVWGERVIPNFRATYQTLCEGYVQLQNGDFSGLRACYGPLSDYKGQADFDTYWMSEQDLNLYGNYLSVSVQIATNIRATETAIWSPFELTSEYNIDARGPLTLPEILPNYRRTNISIASGHMPPRSGLYVPDQINSCAQFLISSRPAPGARVFLGKEPLLHPDTGQQYAEQNIVERHDCTWTYIELVPTTDLQAAPGSSDRHSFRVPGGRECPYTGFYHTPARQNSRARFSAGEIMPTFQAEYGAVIWQWDINQD